MNKTSASASTFSPAIILGLIVAGVFTFAAYFALSAFAPDLDDGNNGGVHALSKSAVGYGALKELLNEIETPVVAPRRPVSDTVDGVTVYTPPTPNAFDEAGDISPYSISLIIMPKWMTVPDPARKGWVRKIAAMSPFEMMLNYDGAQIDLSTEFDASKKSVLLTASDAFGGAILEPIDDAPISELDGLQYFASNDAIEPIIFAGEDRIVLGKVINAPIYVLAEPDILNTHGLRSSTRAAFAVSLFDMIRAGGPVIFDLTLHGITRPRNIVRLALEPPLLAATACALFAVLLLALASSTRFGPPAPTTRVHDFGKTALAENSAALIRVAGRVSSFGARYGALIRRRIAKAHGMSNAPSASVDRFIQRIADSKGRAANFSALQQSISETRNPAKLVQDAKKLRRIEEELVP